MKYHKNNYKTKQNYSIIILVMRVNYPGLKKEYIKIKQSYANRGMDLENLLNETNQYYLEKDIAVIYKKPTPIGINKVRYTNN